MDQLILTSLHDTHHWPWNIVIASHAGPSFHRLVCTGSLKASKARPYRQPLLSETKPRDSFEGIGFIRLRKSERLIRH